VPEKPTGDARNERDLRLLRTDPGRLVVEHRETIRMVVAAFVRSGMFRHDEFEEIVQSITEDLLRLLPRIIAQFNGSVLFRTYLSAILRNCCLEAHSRKQLDYVRYPPPADFGEGPFDPSARADARVYIRLEVATLGAILAQYASKRPKLELLLKIRYRIPIKRADVLSWFPGCPEAVLENLLAALAPMKELSDLELHTLLVPVMDKAEGREHTAEGIRRWTLLRVDEILGLLNGSPPVSAHTSETLGLLLQEKYFPFSGR
jgi:DNA-directed RNA polymerase specialized sigma24 family protein